MTLVMMQTLSPQHKGHCRSKRARIPSERQEEKTTNQKEISQKCHRGNEWRNVRPQGMRSPGGTQGRGQVPSGSGCQAGEETIVRFLEEGEEVALGPYANRGFRSKVGNGAAP